ncbi:MAG: hypothetical protein PHD05_02445 [Sphaerochaetaceae bacterium]|nr:hypothetical protein [Sphaerochaetaceae bacterium]
MKLQIILFILISFFLLGCTEIQNTLVLESTNSTVQNIKFENIEILTTGFNDNYKTVQINFTMQNIGKEKNTQKFYYRLGNNKDYIYDLIGGNAQPTGLLPEDKINGSISFKILKDTSPKILFIYDGSYSLEDMRSALLTGEIEEQPLLGKINISDYVLLENNCRLNEECESQYCNTDTNKCIQYTTNTLPVNTQYQIARYGKITTNYVKLDSIETIQFNSQKEFRKLNFTLVKNDPSWITRIDLKLSSNQQLEEKTVYDSGGEPSNFEFSITLPFKKFILDEDEQYNLKLKIYAGMANENMYDVNLNQYLFGEISKNIIENTINGDSINPNTIYAGESGHDFVEFDFTIEIPENFVNDCSTFNSLFDCRITPTTQIIFFGVSNTDESVWSTIEDCFNTGKDIEQIEINGLKGYSVKENNSCFRINNYQSYILKGQKNIYLINKYQYSSQSKILYKYDIDETKYDTIFKNMLQSFKEI